MERFPKTTKTVRGLSYRTLDGQEFSWWTQTEIDSEDSDAYGEFLAAMAEYEYPYEVIEVELTVTKEIKAAEYDANGNELGEDEWTQKWRERRP